MSKENCVLSHHSSSNQVSLVTLGSSHFMRACSLKDATRLGHVLNGLKAPAGINQERRSPLQTESLPLMQLTFKLEFPEA